jgi:carboxyl-terminal processing protease
VREAEERPAAPRPDAAAVDPKLRDRKPVEFGSADDHQLAQAMNHLKGRPVVVSRPRDAATAATPAAPAAATPSTAPAVPATKSP